MNKHATNKMRNISRIQYLLYIVNLIILTGCSGFGRSIYFAPTGGENWTQDETKYHNDYPPGYVYICDKMTITLSAMSVEDNLYSVGPPFLPVIPTFGLFDMHSAKNGIHIYVSIKGQSVDFELNKESITMLISEEHPLLKSMEFTKRDMHQFPNDLFYQYTFDTNWESVDSFSIRFDDEIKGCKVSVLRFKKIDDYSYHPSAN